MTNHVVRPERKKFVEPTLKKEASLVEVTLNGSGQVLLIT